MAVETRLSVARFIELANVLDPDQRFELLDGRIVAVSPIGPAHAAIVGRLSDELRATLDRASQIRECSPVDLQLLSEYLPQPDISVVTRRDDGYLTMHPTPADIILLVDVSDSEPYRRLAEKLDAYRAATVRNVWRWS